MSSMISEFLLYATWRRSAFLCKYVTKFDRLRFLSGARNAEDWEEALYCAQPNRLCASVYGEAVRNVASEAEVEVWYS